MTHQPKSRDEDQANRASNRPSHLEILEHVDEAVLVRDLKGRIHYWNRGAEKLYGWAGADVIGLKDYELLAAGVGNEYRAAARAVLRYGRESRRLRQTTKQRRGLVVKSNWYPLENDLSIEPRFLVLNTDETERCLLEDYVRHAYRLASIGMLTGGAAHDLNNLLASMQLSLELLEAAAGDQGQERIIGLLRRSVEKSVELLQQLLLLASGEAGGRSSIRPQQLVKEMARFIAATHSKSIEVTSETSGDLPAVVADPAQLCQALVILCECASAAMPGGGELVLSATDVRFEDGFASMRQGARPGRYIRFDVSDTGRGIPWDRLARIFQLFSTDTHLDRGTDLGLWLVDVIAKEHGGFVEVAPREPAGTVSSVFLPVMTESSSPEPPPVAADRVPGCGELVLVVDDEDTIREVISKTLQHQGYRTAAAADGAEAVAVFADRRGEIAAVLMDLEMPVMNGRAAIRALRKLDPSCPIVALTGLVDRSSGIEGVESLHKPFTPPTLLRVVRALLAQRQAG